MLHDRVGTHLDDISNSCSNSIEPFVRVVVLNYERASLTIRCVESILRQNYSNIEVVVVDNHSSVECFNALRTGLNPSVHLIRSGQNVGYAKGNNVGMQYRSGKRQADCYLIVNSDVVFPDTQTCRLLVNALSQNESVACVSPLVLNLRLRNPNAIADVQVRRVPDFWTIMVLSSWWLRRLPGLREFAARHTYDDMRPYPRDAELTTETINGCCFLVDATFIDKIGWLDEGTFLYYEEVILGQQMKSLHKHGCLVTSTVIRHDQGSTTENYSGGKYVFPVDIHRIKSEVYYCRKYLKVGPAHVALLCLTRIIDIITKVGCLEFLRVVRRKL